MPSHRGPATGPLGLVRALHVVVGSSLVGLLHILFGDVGVVCSSLLWVHAVPMISLMNSKAPAIVELAATIGAALQLMGASMAARGRPLR